MISIVVGALLSLSSQKIKILVIEKESKAADSLREGLKEGGYDVHVVYDGEAGRKEIMHRDYDLVVMDVAVPVINGIQLCRLIRERKPEMPVLMLSAVSNTDDKLAGFDAGADDFLVKPFDFRELLARIKVLTKWSGAGETNKLRVADLVLDLDTKIASRGKIKIDLSTKEFALLEFFMRNKDKMLSRKLITEKVWDINFETHTNVVDVYISMLRRKIDRNCEPKLIHTKIGMGYFFGVLSDRK